MPAFVGGSQFNDFYQDSCQSRDSALTLLNAALITLTIDNCKVAITNVACVS